MKTRITNDTQPSVDPDQLVVGYEFTVEHAGTTQKAEVTKHLDDKTYYVEYANGHDGHIIYDEIINMLKKEAEDEDHLWTFEKITTH